MADPVPPAHDLAGGGAVVISLDLELGWGNIERLESDDEYRTRALAARDVVVRLLELFDEFEISATWAIVGRLFGDDRGEWRGRPPRRGAGRASAPPPPGGRSDGWDEREAPALSGPSLIRRILEPGRHEIATHTFSHFYCLDESSTPGRLRAELRAARTVAEWWGIPLSSIVFPRNQHAPEFDVVLLEEGITAYRGNPLNWAWRFRDAESGSHLLRRLVRLLDAYVPFFPARTVAWDEIGQESGLSDVRASFFLRPYTPAARLLEPLRRWRLARAMRRASHRAEILHLWWHPHNFAAHVEENLGFLRSLLAVFRACRESEGMRSMTISEVDRLARAAPAATEPAER